MSATRGARAWLVVLAALAIVVLVAIGALALRRSAREEGALDDRRSGTPSSDRRESVDVEREPSLVADERVDERRAEHASASTATATQAHGPIVVAGRVLDGDKRPFAKARAWIERADDEPAGAERAGERSIDAFRRRASVDASGRFRFADLSPGRWTLEIEAAEHEGLSLDLGELAVGDARIDIDLRLVALPRVRGTVRWPDGAPVARAELDVIDLRSDGTKETADEGSRDAPEPIGSRVKRVRTDDEGRFDVAVPKDAELFVVARRSRALREVLGEAEVRASGLDVGDREVTCAGFRRGIAIPSDGVAIELVPRACVVGRVTDANGAPIAEARVVRSSSRDRVARPSSFAPITDDRGVFVVDDLALGALRLDATVDGAWTTETYSTTLERTLTRLDVQLARFAVVEGVVLDEHGDPAADVRVSLLTADETVPGGFGSAGAQRSNHAPLMQVADEQGRFAFVQVPPGDVVLEASSTLRAARPIAVRVADGATLRGLVVRVETASGIRGRVRRADGAPIRAVRVTWSGAGLAGGTKRDWGDFEVGPIAPGRWTVRVEALDGSGEIPIGPSDERTIDVAADEIADASFVLGP